MNTEALMVAKYIYNKVADRVNSSNFVESLQIAQMYKVNRHYEIPVTIIDDHYYFDPNSKELNRYSRIEDVILLLQDTIDDIGGW